MFKIGDTVICVDPYDREEYLSLGKSYTISNVDREGDFVLLEGIDCLDAFLSSRFILKSETISPFQQWEKEYA